jgi:hypothetical protein
MRDYTTLATLQREGFDIVVDKTWEDIPLDHLFDTSTDPDTGKPYFDIHEMYTQIELGSLDYFMLRVRALVDGHELGSSYVGGFLYEDASEVLRDGTADSMIDEAVDEARKEALRLVGSLQRVVDTAAV